MDILKFNEQSLSKLKYVHLQKLAHKHNIKKRWAKKEELVHCLISAKEKLLESSESQDNQLNEEAEWMDGASFMQAKSPSNDDFKDLQTDDGRSTFTIEKFNDLRGTYDLTNAINTILPALDGSLDSRLTFDVPKTRRSPNNGVDMYSTETAADLSKKKSVAGPKVKMLTIPYSPVGSRAPAKKSIHQLSSKSIAIKKTKVGASPLKVGSTVASGGRILRPILPHSTASTHFNRRIVQTTTKGINAQVKELKTAMKTEIPVIKQIKNIPVPERHLSTRRKSKSDDPSARRSIVQNAAGTFRTPPAKVQSAAKKPTEKVTVTKMPDFASIHEKQFQKMDSLDEYINKKAERVKKLFGTPFLQKPVEKVLKPLNGSTLRGVKEESTVGKIILPKLTHLKENARKLMKSNPNLRTQTDVKDKTRSHIHGIRTNRRFELQMKFRNL